MLRQKLLQPKSEPWRLVAKLNVQPGLFFEPEVLGTQVDEIGKRSAEVLHPSIRTGGLLHAPLYFAKKRAQILVFRKNPGAYILGIHTRSFPIYS
ncbi:MAG: hypothetical protein AMJ62_14020 [Myxococcales bacterium SG8_38]|nr:MAG: hypothetical protein AMJ62_14020 [Myxococcales bacterium SG8_38]